MKKKIVVILTGIIFAFTFLTLAQVNDEVIMSSGLAISVEMALADHSCDGQSCHAYDVNGQLKCDACCATGSTPVCSRMGCSCSSQEP